MVEELGEEAAAAASAGAGGRSRRRGTRAGRKHAPGKENALYSQACNNIRAQLGRSTHARFGRCFELPFITPQTARREYSDWFRYVLKHSNQWTWQVEGEALPIDMILTWSTLLPELWHFLHNINPQLLQETPQPRHRVPQGYWKSDHLFVPLRNARAADAKVAAPRMVFNSAPRPPCEPRADRSRSVDSSLSAAKASDWRPSLRQAFPKSRASPIHRPSHQPPFVAGCSLPNVVLVPVPNTASSTGGPR